MSFPIFSVFGIGKNGSSTLYQSIHKDKQDYPAVPLQPSEEQRFNKFHLHFFDSLETVKSTFPDREHRIVYPVRRDLGRQLVSIFIQYAKRIDEREDRLGLPVGSWDDWSLDHLVDAFDEFVKSRHLPDQIGEYHQRFFERYDLAPTSLKGLQVFDRGADKVALLHTDQITTLMPAFAQFCSPSKVTAKQSNITAAERVNVFEALVPRVEQRLAEPLRQLRAAFPALYC